jgi:hypothetical protein
MKWMAAIFEISSQKFNKIYIFQYLNEISMKITSECAAMPQKNHSSIRHNPSEKSDESYVIHRPTRRI